MPIADDWLQPFATLCAGVADLDAGLSDPVLGVEMRMERAELDLPIELDVRADDRGVVTIASAPPTQQVETSYMPVFHRIRMTVTADERS